MNAPLYHLSPVEAIEPSFEEFCGLCWLWPTDILDNVRRAGVFAPTVLVACPGSDSKKATVWHCNLTPELRMGSALDQAEEDAAIRLVDEIVEQENPLFIAYVAPIQSESAELEEILGTDQLSLIIAFSRQEARAYLTGNGIEWYQLNPNDTEIFDLLIPIVTRWRQRSVDSAFASIPAPSDVAGR